MNDDEVPEGSAMMPEIPEELGVSPLFLAMLHAYVFLEGSVDDIVNDKAASECLEFMAMYLQRLQGADLQKAKEDVTTLVGFAKEDKWPTEVVDFLKTFLADNGVEV